MKSSQDALDVAYEIFEFVESQIPKPIANKQEEDSEASDCDGEGFKDGDKIPSTKISDEDFDKILKNYEENGASSDDGSKAEGDEAKKSGGKMPDLTPRQREQLRKAIAKQEDFLREDVKKKKLSKKDARSMKAMEESGISVENVDYDRETWSGEKINSKQEVYVVRDVTQSLIDSGQFDGMWAKDNWSQPELFSHSQKGP